MGFIQNVAAANVGLISKNVGELVALHRREVEQNDQIIELLQENLGYLAAQKAHEVEQERRDSMVAPGPRR